MARIMTMDGDQVQFVLNSGEDLNPEALSDIIYPDGTRAILVDDNGQILQSETQAVVLQDDDLNQYYINDENGEILVADDHDISATQSVEDAEVVQFIDFQADPTGEQQVIYINEEGYTINNSDLAQYQIAESEDTEEVLTSGEIKLETQVVDLEELLRQQNENETAIIDDSGDANTYQYAILKDGKLHIQSYSSDAIPISSIEEEESPAGEANVDISRITGRNLLTGQTVSLHGYMDKLQRKIKDTRMRETDISKNKKKTNRSAGLKGLLNKKLTLGKTSTGKRLVGKVIHVEKKKRTEREDSGGVLEAGVREIGNGLGDVRFEGADENGETFGLGDSRLPLLADTDVASEAAVPTERPANRSNLIVGEQLVSKECFGHVRRTLSGLMSMDTVRKKLQDKNVIVKVVERRFRGAAAGGFAKKVSYVCGFLREEFVVNDEGDMLGNWSFVPDRSLRKAVLGEEECADDEDASYLDATNVTVVITYEPMGHRAIRVILNPSGLVKCSDCDWEFPTGLQLRAHFQIEHGRTTGDEPGLCQVCGLQLADDPDAVSAHREAHVDEGKMFRCKMPDCGTYFFSVKALAKHNCSHISSPLKCPICAKKFHSEAGLKRHVSTGHAGPKQLACAKVSSQVELNLHRRLHRADKLYSCDVCKRTFSRHSNLQRHLEIHKGSEELYQCSICGCSYHYMSSLTRHVVQNHIKRREGGEEEEGAPVLVESEDGDSGVADSC